MNTSQKLHKKADLPVEEMPQMDVVDMKLSHMYEMYREMYSQCRKCSSVGEMDMMLDYCKLIMRSYGIDPEGLIWWDFNDESDDGRYQLDVESAIEDGDPVSQYDLDVYEALGGSEDYYGFKESIGEEPPEWPVFKRQCEIYFEVINRYDKEGRQRSYSR